MFDRLYKTRDAAALLGIGQEDLRRLIRNKRLTAKQLTVRGRGGRPRLLVAESELRRYAAALPEAGSSPVPMPPVAEPSVSRRSRKRGVLTGVQEFI